MDVMTRDTGLLDVTTRVTCPLTSGNTCQCVGWVAPMPGRQNCLNNKVFRPVSRLKFFFSDSYRKILWLYLFIIFIFADHFLQVLICQWALKVCKNGRRPLTVFSTCGDGAIISSHYQFKYNVKTKGIFWTVLGRRNIIWILKAKEQMWHLMLIITCSEK